MNNARQKILPLIRKYRFNSIFFSYFRYTLALMIVPLIIVIVFMTQNTYNNVQSETQQESYRAYERLCYLSDNIIEKLNNICNQLLSDDEITCLLTSDTSEFSSFNLLKSVSKFDSFSRNILISSDMFNSIFLYSGKNGYIYSTDSSNTIDEFFNRDWYEAYIKNSRNNTVCSSVAVDNEKVISFVMNIYNDTPTAGVIVFNIKKSYLDSFFEDLNDSDISFCSYFFSGKEMVYSFGEASESSCALSHSHEIKGFPLSFKLFLMCNLESLTLRQMLPIIYSYFILIIFSVIFVAFLCSLKFYKSIANIVTSIENAYPAANTENESTNEINYINKNITDILLRSMDVEKELVSHFSDLKKAQSIALQSQMNPHFLFNTLNLVNSIIIEDCGGDTEAVKVIKGLSELLSLSLDTKNYIIPLESELNYAKKYIDIELVRNDYNFSVKWDIQKDVLFSSTLKMILQPILENAIFHGISTLPDTTPGKITVCAYKENSSLVISVTDNGTGIEKERLLEIEEKLNSGEIAQSKHIGLANVNSRIKLIYGNEYGCSIKTSSNGTAITIIQPIQP